MHLSSFSNISIMLTEMEEGPLYDIYTDIFSSIYDCYDQNTENMTLITDSCASLICSKETLMR